MASITGIVYKNQYEKQKNQPLSEILKKSGNNVCFAHGDSFYEAAYCKTQGEESKEEVLYPFSSFDNGRYSLFLKGSIFNYKELIEELPNRGSNLETRDKKEVLLRLYSQYGAERFSKVNGGYSLIIRDSRLNQTFVICDQLGIKVLYYYKAETFTIFSSEIKNILAHPKVLKEIDIEGVANHLIASREILDESSTPFLNISRLRPAEYMDIRHNKVSTGRYWSINSLSNNPPYTLEEYAEKVKFLLTDSVRLRMPGDKLIAAALSGGFDSSSVVCLMDHINKNERGNYHRLETFSFDFDDPEADELELIDIVSKKSGTLHTNVSVVRDDFFDELEKIIRYSSLPTLENSVLLLWWKKKMASERGASVLLSGLGGDEIFMGRLNYFADLFKSGRWYQLIKEIRSYYPIDYSTGKKTSLKKLLRAYILSYMIPAPIKNIRHKYFDASFPPSWISQNIISNTSVRERLLERKAKKFRTVYDQDCYEVFFYELLNGAVYYHNIVSEAFSIETRFPILDIRLVELMFAAPRETKLANGKVRIVHKKAMEGYLPKEVLNDHLKKNFHPVLNAFQRKIYKTKMDNFFKQKSHISDEYINWKELKRLYDDFLCGKLNNPSPLWTAINLEIWMAQHFS